MKLKLSKLTKIVISIIVGFVVFQLLSIDRRVESFEFLSNPQLRPGDRFYLRTANGEYLSVCEGCEPIDQNLDNKCESTLCLKPEPVRSSIFIYIPHRDGTFSVKSEATGKYWKRCDNCIERCPNVICTDGVNPRLQPAKFVLIKLSGRGPDESVGTVAIKTDTGRMLEVNECDQACGRVVAAIGVGLNKEFRLERLPDRSIRQSEHERKPTKPFIVPSYAPISIPFTGS